MHYQLIHKSIEFIEQHLEEDLDLEKVAKAAGLSKYHFHRIFRKYVNKNVHEYIRARRLSQAANLLLYSETRILEIALQYGFESQEAFTRAFKEIYDLPPAQYRSQVRLLIQEREVYTMSEITGWYITGTHQEKYKVEIDLRVCYKTSPSMHLRSSGEAAQDDNGFGTLMQQFQAREYRGRRMRFSGFVRTEEVTGWSGLWMRVDDNKQNMLAFDNMQNRSIQGTTEWNHYACVMDIPSEADVINIGILLSGSGQVWLGECEFEEVGKEVPVTDGSTGAENLPSGPQNLKFDQQPEHSASS
ncbi:AraC family transcriptional regulator [Paenibacillus sp. FSL H8-0122]|uniref:helix-turn-helix transcriptional regulator n=1 Tax=Paenibacillus sp. FSL H8-0122 TaxID=2954510 RepID=UPI0030FA27B6